MKIIRSKKYIFLFFVMVILFAILFTEFAQVYAVGNDPTSARAMVVLDGTNDVILYGNDEHLQLPMASTTKIATAIVAIENCEDLEKKFVVSNKAVGIEGTSIYIKEGEELSMKELLQGLILASGNDCAVAIAEYFGYDDFMLKMNSLPVRLGLKNTHFDNPHGLDSDAHYTSAYDLAMITDYALDNEVFRELVSTKRVVIEPTNVSSQRYLKHKNQLLFTMDNCIGVKTGFTDNAGRCLVNAHEENGLRIISVVLNCGPMFDECKRLTRMALDEYEVVQFVAPYSYVSDVNVSNGDKNKISVVTIEEFSPTIKKNDKSRYSVKYDIPQVVEAPIAVNSVVGKVYVYFDDEVIYSSDLYAIDSTRNIDIKHILNNIIKNW